MRTTEAARYARWAATAAFVIAAVVAGVFMNRARIAREARRQAPPPVPPAVQQQSAEFSFSKVEKDRTLFTVRASRATEFKEGSRNLLEDVWITIYGRTGQRFDNIHTRSCEYISNTGRIVCAGDVEMDLESAEDARQHPAQAPGANPAARVIHIRTSNVVFDRESGEARTDRPVSFRFPYGEGKGTGMSYSTQRGVVRLEREVALTLVPAQRPSAAPEKTPEGVALSGSSLEYHRDTRILRLLGAVQARKGARELAAGELALELDATLRARRLVASRRPELRSAEPRGQAVLAAEEMAALFHSAGWIERVVAKGSVRGSMKGPAGEDHLESRQLEMEMLPRINQARAVTASGDVKAASTRRGVSRRLETQALRLLFTDGAKPSERRLDRAETLAPAAVEWAALAGGGSRAAPDATHMRAQRLAAEFDARNQLRTLTGRDAVEIERRLPGRAAEVTSAREFAAQFSPTGDWTVVDESGSVRLSEGDRSAQAEHAHLERANDTVTLTGSVVVNGPATRTTADSATFNQRTGEFHADGSVRSTELSASRGGVTNLAPQSANLSADHLVGNSSGGRAVYSGRARLWQGDALIEADSIELLQESRQLNARGNVFAIFPQAATTGSGPLGSPPAKPAAAPAKTGSRSASAGPDLWRVRSGTLAYWSAESRARLEQNVSAESRQGQITGRVLELFFSSGTSLAAANSAGGPQQLNRAVATGGVSVRQGDRRGTADRAEYTAADAKFVLSGGHPTLYDAFRGTTTGRQLTFYFADDTIVVESEEGSRTLTRHRVEK